MALSIKILFALVAAAWALPQAEVIPRANLACEIIGDVVSVLKANSVATPFCSSFLSIGTKTSTSTTYSTPAAAVVTSTNVITGTVQQTIESIITSQVFDSFTSQITDTFSAATTTVITESDTVSFTDVVTATITDTFISTVTTIQTDQFTQTSTVLTPNRQRDVQERANPIPTPSAYKSLGSQLLSAGCSCLSIPSPTTSLITTSVLPKATSTVLATASVTTTSLTTTSSTVIVTNDVTIDTTADVTNTATVSATIQSTIDVTTVLTASATADVTTPVTVPATTSVTSTTVISTPAPCGTNAPNLVYNSGLDGYAGWNITSTGGGTYYNDGECSPDYYCPLLYTNGPGSITFQQTINTVPGQEYSLSYYYIPNGSNYQAACAAGSTVLPINQSANPHAFDYVSTTFVATTAQTDFSCYAECSASGCSASVNLDAPTVVAVCT